MVDRLWSGHNERVHPHAHINHMVFFLCYGFIKYMLINKILMKTRLFYIMCYNVTLIFARLPKLRELYDVNS